MARPRVSATQSATLCLRSELWNPSTLWGSEDSIDDRNDRASVSDILVGSPLVLTKKDLASVTGHSNDNDDDGCDGELLWMKKGREVSYIREGEG